MVHPVKHYSLSLCSITDFITIALTTCDTLHSSEEVHSSMMILDGLGEDSIRVDVVEDLDRILVLLLIVKSLVAVELVMEDLM